MKRPHLIRHGWNMRNMVFKENPWLFHLGLTFAKLEPWAVGSSLRSKDLPPGMQKMPSPPPGDDSESDDDGPGGQPGAELAPTVAATGNATQKAPTAPVQSRPDAVVSVGKYHWNGPDGQPLRQLSQTSGAAPPEIASAANKKLDQGRVQAKLHQPPSQQENEQAEAATKPKIRGRGKAKINKPAGPTRQQPGRKVKEQPQAGAETATALAPAAPAPTKIAPKKATSNKAAQKQTVPKKQVPPEAPAKKTAAREAAPRQANKAAQPRPPRPPIPRTQPDDVDNGEGERDVVERDTSAGAVASEGSRKRTVDEMDPGDGDKSQGNEQERVAEPPKKKQLTGKGKGRARLRR